MGKRPLCSWYALLQQFNHPNGIQLLEGQSNVIEFCRPRLALEPTPSLPET